MTYNGGVGKLFVVQNDHLQRIDNLSTGAYTVLGGAIWDNSTSMTSIGSSLYIIRNSVLYQVSATTGTRASLGGSWSGATRMVAQSVASSNALFVTQGSNLYRVDPATGGSVLAGSANWTGTTSMFCHDSFHSFLERVGIFQNSRLHDVPWDGSYTVLGLPEWAGPVVSAGDSCNL